MKYIILAFALAGCLDNFPVEPDHLDPTSIDAGPGELASCTCPHSDGTIQCGGLTYQRAICHCSASTGLCYTWSTVASCGGPIAYYIDPCTGGNLQPRQPRSEDHWFPDDNACSEDLWSLYCGTVASHHDIFFRPIPHPDAPSTCE